MNKLQEAKGFKPSRIVEKKAKKEKLYDDFVDGYSSVESDEYSEITSKDVFSKRTTRIILVLFVLIAFGVGIMAGTSALETIQNDTPNNITVTDSAFSPNDTVVSADNITPANTTQNITTSTTKKKSTVTKTTTKKSSSSKSTNTKKSSSSSSKKSSSSGSSSSGSSSSSSNSAGTGTSSSHDSDPSSDSP